MYPMRHSLFLAALISIPQASAACEVSLPLSGVVTVPTCERDDLDCRPSAQALYEYTEAQPDDPTSFSIALHASPWRFYDPKMRIITVEELAEMVRANREPKHTRVELFASWTGVAPSVDVPSLAARLSRALEGFPVEGEDGFLWMDRKGAMRTTHQAFTMRRGVGTYSVPAGEEVMVSLVAGWAAGLEDKFGPGDADLMLHAAVGQDVFLLCPDGALAGFEAAAKWSNAIAAYNAALVRLERNHAGDHEAAIKLLERAAELGDAKSASRLKELQSKGHKVGLSPPNDSPQSVRP